MKLSRNREKIEQEEEKRKKRKNEDDRQERRRRRHASDKKEKTDVIGTVITRPTENAHSHTSNKL